MLTQNSSQRIACPTMSKKRQPNPHLTLDTTSLEWAIESITKHSDGDIFPKILELQPLSDEKQLLLQSLSNVPLTELNPGASRRFIVPKDEISYRLATQLDPQDSIILTALLHRFGQGIEDRRQARDIVFSYRFGPSQEHGLYSSQSAWNEFWERAQFCSLASSNILYCDIADFYNQIYHHTVENQLIDSSFPNQAIKWIIRLLESTTEGVSRGVPIGPHSIHLIAEATLIPVDNALAAEGMNFLRFADDILVFCSNKREARSTLGRIASILDKQQRLILQRHKTQFLSPNRFRKLCSQMVEDRPINDDEKEMLNIVRKYSKGNPYAFISYDQVDEEDWEALSEEKISSIIKEYVGKSSPDYIRLRWFYRRLAQIGHPGAVRISLKMIDKLGPCFANICSYLASVQNIEPEDWKDIGHDLLSLLESDAVKENEFFRLSILSLFGRNTHLNHFSTLAARYSSSDPYARREILLAAYRNEMIDWAREHKEAFDAMDIWQQRAFLLCCSQFPTDERKYFLRRRNFSRPMDASLCEWAKNGSR